MNKILKLAILAIFTMFAVACTRIETGEVGIRVGFDKQVVREELLPGSFNQVLIGDRPTFVREVGLLELGQQLLVPGHKVGEMYAKNEPDAPWEPLIGYGDGSYTAS